MKEHSGPSEAAADTDLLRRALGTFATGVTVVTVGGETPHAMTANSFTSVSLDPPLVLVCVEHSAVMHGSLLARGTFGVSVLAAHQEPVARQFASRLRPLGLAQFDAVDWRPGRLTGAPLIEGALAHFECGLWRSYDGGDHTIFVGNLLSVESSRGERSEPSGVGTQPADSEAVVFFRGRFRRLAQEITRIAQ